MSSANSGLSEIDNLVLSNSVSIPTIRIDNMNRNLVTHILFEMLILAVVRSFLVIFTNP